MNSQEVYENVSEKAARKTNGVEKLYGEGGWYCPARIINSTYCERCKKPFCRTGVNETIAIITDPETLLTFRLGWLVKVEYS